MRLRWFIAVSQNCEKMAKVKLGLSGLKPLEAVAKARNLVTKQTGNPLFATPEPPLATITQAATDLENAYNEAINRDSVKVAERKSKQEILLGYMRENAFYVQQISDSDGDTIISAGWELVSTVRTPVGPLEPAQGLKVLNYPGYAGQLKLIWDKVRGCSTFIVKRTTTPENPESFEPIGISTKTSFVDTEAVSGTMYFYTVTSVGPLGEGGVSEVSNGRAL